MEGKCDSAKKLNISSSFCRFVSREWYMALRNGISRYSPVYIIRYHA